MKKFLQFINENKNSYCYYLVSNDMDNKTYDIFGYSEERDDIMDEIENVSDITIYNTVCYGWSSLDEVKNYLEEEGLQYKEIYHDLTDIEEIIRHLREDL